MEIKRILHIDDDEDDHEIFAAALSQVSAATELIYIDSAKRALQNLANRKLNPDMIFLDLNMPEMSGQEFLFEIKKHQNLKEIPIIIVSTSSHPATIELAKDTGAKEFITKPDKLEDLVAILRTVLN